MADYTVNSILEQCNAFLAMGDSNYLLSTFEERLSALENLTAEQKQSYISQNHELLSSSILPAYEHLVSALTKLKGSGKNESMLRLAPTSLICRQLPPKIQLSLRRLPSLTTFRRLPSYSIWNKTLPMHFQNLQMSPLGLNMFQTHWNHT